MYPTWFEFNSYALEFILDSLFSARFGTFLCNCDRERTTLDVAHRTPSLWAHMNGQRARFTNHFYRPSDMPLLPPLSTVLRQVCLWTDYYCRSSPVPTVPSGNPIAPMWTDEQRPWQPPRTSMEDLEATVAGLNGRIQQLESQLATRTSDLKTIIAEAPKPKVDLPPPPSNTWRCRLCTKINTVTLIK